MIVAEEIYKLAILYATDDDIAEKGIPEKSFKYSGAKLWYSLSREAKESKSIFSFKQNLVR